MLMLPNGLEFPQGVAPGFDPTHPASALAIDPELFLRAPFTRRSLFAPSTVRDLRAAIQRLSLPRGAPFTGIPMIWTDCTTSTTITTPGGYAGKVGGITFTLAATARGGPVQVKALAVPINVIDALGASFDAGATTTFTLPILNEMVTFTWSAGDSSWLVG